MENINLQPFYVGQKVVYITGINMQKNSIHTVLECIKMNCKCNRWLIKIKTNSAKQNLSKDVVYVECDVCRSYIPIEYFLKYENGLWQSKSFRPLQQHSFPLITLSKIQEMEKCKIEQSELLGGN